MPELFLDANVLFTAAYSPDGRAAALIELAKRGRCELLTSPHALTEARRNLKSKYPEPAEQLEKEIMAHVTVVAEATPEGVRVGLRYGLPLKDAPILGAALEAGADMLVTGDIRHFGHLQEEPIRGMKVVSPASALADLVMS